MAKADQLITCSETGACSFLAVLVRNLETCCEFPLVLGSFLQYLWVGGLICNYTYFVLALFTKTSVLVLIMYAYEGLLAHCNVDCEHFPSFSLSMLFLDNFRPRATGALHKQL
jgi:hypothetical protein